MFPQKAPDPAERGFGRRDVTDAVKDAVWKELSFESLESVPPRRRQLQREYLRVAARLLVDDSNQSAPPSEARAVIRADLQALSRRIAQVLEAGTMDRPTREHLQDLQYSLGSVLAGRPAV